MGLWITFLGGRRTPKGKLKKIGKKEFDGKERRREKIHEDPEASCS